MAAAMLLGATPDASAQQASDQPGVFGEIIDVRVINVEVVVTDKEGNRVPGLTPDQFRLLIDGEEVPIEFFTEIRSGIAMGAPGVEEGMEFAPGTAAGQAVGTSYLVFIDDFFSVAQDRKIVLDSLKTDIQALGPEDRMAIVAFDGRDLEMLTSWTSSIDKLEEAIEEARERPARGLQRISERNRFDDTDQVYQISELLRYDDRQVSLDTYLSPEERFYANMLAGQVERAVQGAAATLRSFAAPPGRKVMLLASGGWPYLPSEYVVSDFRRTVYDTMVPGGGKMFRPLTETANRLGYTIYPIDVPGFDRTAADPSRSLAGQQFRRVRDPFPQGRGVGGRNSTFVRENEVHYALQFMAEETGGEALLNSNRRGAFRHIQEDTRSYYWLGFTPSWQGDDVYHEVTIEVTDPSLKVRNRSGFQDLSRVQETTMFVESALLFGSPPSENPLRLTFGRPEKGGFKKMLVPLRIDIPLEQLVFLPSSEGGNQAHLELRVAVIDEKGAQADIPVIPILISGPGEPTPGSYYSYDVSLKMRRETHRAVVAVYDQASGTILSGTAEVSP